MDKRLIMARLVVACVALCAWALAGPALAQGPTRIIFLHHSCGHNLIEQGGVREGLSALGYEFYDHGYNGDGLRLADGSYSGTHFDVPGDNTDPDGIAEIFSQPLHDPPDNTFSHLMEYDVIAFKSCFPTSNIASDAQLDEYKSYYLSVRDRMDQHPGKMFIVVTQPPQVPGASDRAEARRARALADWLKSDEFLAGHPNVATFDFFGHLAGDDNFLRPAYRLDDHDGHPNERANREIGPRFVDFVDQAIRGYEGGGPRPTLPPSTPTTPAEEEESSPPPPEAPPPSGDLPTIDDFEGETGPWYTDAETGSTIACGPDSGNAHAGAGSLRIAYDVAADGWVDCGRSFESPQNWSGGAGVSMWLHAEGTPQWITLMLFSGDPDAATPFEVAVELPPESAGGWTEIGFPWDSFARAEWASDGLTDIDPTRIIGYGLSLGGGEGVLWVDDVCVSSGAAPPPVAPGPPTEEPIEEPGEAEQAGGGICAGAALALPLSLSVLGLSGRLLSGRRREKRRCG